MQRDYNICLENLDGKHRLNNDAEAVRVDYDGRLLVDVFCKDCGRSTGVFIGPANKLEWN